MTFYDKLLGEIAEFRAAAFERHFSNVGQRKMAMKMAARSCGDAEIRHILAKSVDDIFKHPEWVSGAIRKARGHVETLRYNRPDLADL
jgi:hypothetical protein